MRCQLHDDRDELIRQYRWARDVGFPYQDLVERARQINWRIVARLLEG